MLNVEYELSENESFDIWFKGENSEYTHWYCNKSNKFNKVYYVEYMASLEMINFIKNLGLKIKGHV